jgi:hypothetical protein
MCDPVSLALASTAATVVGAGGSLMSSMGAQKAAQKQQQEVLAWQQEQKRARDAASVRQEELRAEADKSRVAGLEELSGEAQGTRQKEEEARLTDYLQGKDQVAADESGAPISASDAALAGQNTSTTSDTFKSDLAAAINTATKGARERMAALAGVSSYGNSLGGLGNTNKEILTRSGADIDMFNELRRGNLGVLEAQKAVDPVQVTYTPSPLADAFSTALQVGAQGMGNYGKALTGGGGFGKAAATTINSDPWANLRQTVLPKTAPIPTPRVF